MTKAELISTISQKSGLEKSDVEATIETLFSTIKTSLTHGNVIYLRGFGSFQNKKRAQRNARNIKRNTTITVEAHEYPSFKPSKIFIEKIKKSKIG